MASGRQFVVWVVLASLPQSGCTRADPLPLRVNFVGMADASAAVALGPGRILVADDDDNRLRVYAAAGGEPQLIFDWSRFLALEGEHSEVDVEAAARIGRRVHWLGSHSNAGSGEPRPNRHRFFATDLEADTSGVSLRPVGAPSRRVLDDLRRSPAGETLRLDASVERSPDDGGINFEGLAVREQGGLWLGLRSPLVRDRAVLVPFVNPDDVLLAGTAARFGAPVLLNLAGLGIRDLLNVDGALFLIAGGTGRGQQSRLYRWREGDQEPVALQVSLEGFNAEALVAADAGGGTRLLLLADEGASGERHRFRGRWFEP